MKNIRFGILLTLLAGLLIIPACTKAISSINGSGKIVDQDLKVTNFDSIDVKGEYIVEIVPADYYRVTLSTDDNLFKRIIVSVERKTLKLSIEAPASFFPTSLKVKIYMPELVAINLSGGARAVISGFTVAEDFSLFLSEKSVLQGTIKGENVTIHLSGASGLSLAGSAIALELFAQDNSKADLANLELLKCTVRMQKNSEAVVNVKGRFDVELKSFSKLFFLGNPVFSNASITGGSSMSMIQPKQP